MNRRFQPSQIAASLLGTVAVVATLVVATAGAPLAQAQAARDFINVVGSSTVYPFTTAVAEQFGLPVKFVGLGEGAADLEPFDPAQFVAALLDGALAA